MRLIGIFCRKKNDLSLTALDEWFFSVSAGLARERARAAEKADGNYSAYVPDLPGCIATGESLEAAEQEIREAIKFHIEGMIEDGITPPEPTSVLAYVDA